MEQQSQIGKVITRIKRVADLLKLEPWLLEKLTSFKLRWSSDIEAPMDDGSLRQFRAVRIWHRSPFVDQPFKGGLRFHPQVNEDIMLAHAIEMSLKCWLAGIKWGGAKGGVAVDPNRLSVRELKALTEALVDAMDERNILGPFRDVPAPDVNTTPVIMNWIRQRYAQRRRSREDARFAGVVTGKPVEYGFDGIPGRNEATGYGMVRVLESVLRKFGYSDNSGLSVNLVGFGNVGSNFAREAQASGFRFTGVADEQAVLYNPEGIEISALLDHAARQKTIKGFSGAEILPNLEALMARGSDIFVPAALENSIHQTNVDCLRTKFVLEGANGPTTPEADEVLKAKGVAVIPDILANVGGVTVSFFEWARNVNIRDERVPEATREKVLAAMTGMLLAAADEVISRANSQNISLRDAAYETAIERVAPLFRSKHSA